MLSGKSSVLRNQPANIDSTLRNRNCATITPFFGFSSVQRPKSRRQQSSAVSQVPSVVHLRPWDFQFPTPFKILVGYDRCPGICFHRRSRINFVLGAPKYYGLQQSVICRIHQEPYLMAVISFLLFILLFVKTPAPASKWIEWGRLPPSLDRATISTVAEPSHLEIYQSYETGLTDPLDAEGYNNQEDLNEEERKEVEKEEEEETDPEWLRGYPNPRPQRSPSHIRFMTLATMVKNKRRWLREWVEFHLMMGFEHIIIYDNESQDEPYEILKAYVDQGLLTYIPWPPSSIPPMPTTFVTRTERLQYQWLHDALETCYSSSWAMHKQGPCQMAAFVDAIFRTKGGISRWLAVWDVDEYIFPREGANMTTLSAVIRKHYADVDHLRFHGSVFGTSGHIVTPERRPGSPLPPLMTEEYTLRAQLHRENPACHLSLIHSRRNRSI